MSNKKRLGFLESVLMDVSSSWPGWGAELKRQDPGRPAGTHALSHRVYVARVCPLPPGTCTHSAAALAPGEVPPTAQQCLSRPGPTGNSGCGFLPKNCALSRPGRTWAPAGCLAASGGPTRSRKQEPWARSSPSCQPPLFPDLSKVPPGGCTCPARGPGPRQSTQISTGLIFVPWRGTVATVPGCLVL